MGGFTGRKDSDFITFDGGVDEFRDPVELDNNRLLSAVNIHIDGGKLKKRPGRRPWGPGFAYPFDGVHEYIDPDGIARLLVASQGNIYQVDAEGKTIIDSGLPVEKVHVQTHRGRCWINSATIQRKITRGIASRVGIEAPESAPLATPTGIGLTGNYAWKMTFVIEEDDGTGEMVKVWESNPSLVVEQNLTNQSVTLSGVASSDLRVNARYFYRTTASGSIYQYTTKISDNIAVSTVIDSTIDAELGELLELNHGVPVQSSISEGANERLFWIDRDKLRYSEQAHTEAYQEYQRATNFQILQKGGYGTALKRLFNANTAREDLYVFQNDATHILPQADPNGPLHTLSNHKGCIQQDTIVEYNGKLVFLSNKNTIELLSSNRLIDISTYNWPHSLKAVFNKSECTASLIFDRYYAICCQENAGQLYSNSVWICDLQSIQETKEGFAKACWFKWNLDAQYILQLQDGRVLLFDNNSKGIYELSFENLDDRDNQGGSSDIVAEWQTKDFFYGLYTRFRVHYMHIKGRQARNLGAVAYSADRQRTRTDNALPSPLGTPFIMGISTMGSQTTQVPYQIEGYIKSKTAGIWTGFKFSKGEVDPYFELSGMQFSYTAFKRV